MAILALCGSMRAESNTNKLVRKVCDAAGCECDIVDFGRLTIKPCTGCGMCMMNEGACPIEDDMQPLYEKLMHADGLVIGSPTYYMDISGAVKTFIDRSMAVYYRGVGPEYHPDMPWMGQRPLADKPAVCLVTVAGGGHERAIETLRMCIGDIHRLNVVECLAEIVGMNDVDDMPEVLERAEAAGRKLAAAL